MLLAELEVFHSRPIAPTRRVALGSMVLPVEGKQGFGAILLGGIVADSVTAIPQEMVDDLLKLSIQLEAGMRIPQPRLRHRLQVDRVGLQRSTHRLFGVGDELRFSLAESAADPVQHALAAVYAAGRVDDRHRRQVMTAIRTALAWRGEVGPDLIAALATGGRAWTRSAGDPVGWALQQLGFEVGAADGGPTRAQIQRQFRRILMEIHPDHGGEASDAARRIAELDDARRILLGTGTER